MSKNLDQRYLGKLEKIDYQPIFILGLHRSGTSILYKMLTATGCFNPVTAYHLIRYNQLLYDYENNKVELSKKELTESFRKKGLKDRGIDRLQITADFAEEYGFLLGQKTFQMYITPKNLPFFIELGKKVQYISNNKKPILFKNPYDLSNFLYIKQKFPNAKFIFIHRNPFKSLSSNIKAVKLILQDKNPYTTQLFKLYNKAYENPLFLYPTRWCFLNFSSIGVMLLTLYSSRVVKYYLKNIKHLSNQDYVSITYEDLCINPQKNIETIMKDLDIAIPKKIDFSSFIKPRKTDLDPSVKQLRFFIYKCMEDYFEEFGYCLEDYL